MVTQILIFFSSYTTIIELIACSDTTKYRIRFIPGRGLVRMSGEARNSLSFRKLASHSSFHYVPSCFFNNLKIGLVVFSKNLDNATSLPMSLCTSFKVFGILISMIVTHFSELASIPLWVRMKTRNFPPCTPNMHFLEFNVMLYFHICVNISTKSSM